jgi:DNA polymerase
VTQQPRATIDFETRSECSIRNCGSWRYSLDPTTSILCLGFRLPYWTEGRTALWHPAFPHLEITEADAINDLSELFEWTMNGGLVEAHNAWFERGIWVNQCLPMGWPEIAPQQWRCSAAKAAAHALPRALDDVCEALDLPITKDAEGHKVMRKVTSPRKPIKVDIQAWNVQHRGCHECGGKGKQKIGRAKAFSCPECDGYGYLAHLPCPPLPTLWHESRDLYEQLFAYCRQDVLAEEAVSNALHDLNANEANIYLMDQLVNERGFMLDTEAVDTALELIDIECADLNAELAVLTGGEVTKASQRAKMITWFEGRGLFLEDTQKETIAAMLAQPDVTPEVRRGLELMQLLGRSSTAKYEAMSNWVCPDSRIHGGLLYHGASTGRWTGAGVQPHNFVRSKIADMDRAWTVIKSRDRDRMIAEIVDSKGHPIGGVMDVLAHALRGTIIPSPGCELFVADYAAIEARVLLWLADDQPALDVFRNGEDIYCYMATDIYGYPVTKANTDERQLGKTAVLGLGYQMGWSKFIDTAALQGITLTQEFAQEVVNTYRRKFWRVKDLWERQENCAIEAVDYQDCEVEADGITWTCEGRFLYCRLPSGRSLAYADPEIHSVLTPWGKMKRQLTFMGINGFNRQWQRQKTYGGSLVENLVQAISRDLMAEAMWRCEQSGVYVPVLSVHDELIGEAESGRGDVHEFEQLMSALPVWAEGCPVVAEGWKGARYRK